MFSTIRKNLKLFFQRVSSNIAFFPILISIGFMILSWAVLKLESNDDFAGIKSELPDIFIQDAETARAMVTTLFGGILSLTVFSFSMVMVVLNQASSNYSPRLLPGLIRNRNHQVILGFYIGYLIYLVAVAIRLRYYEKSFGLVGISVMLAAILGVVCIFLFVYFIHSISESVQVQNIIKNQYNLSSSKLERISKRENHNTEDRPVDFQDYPVEIRSNQFGYFNGYDDSILPQSVKKIKGLSIHVSAFEGQYIYPNDLLCRLNIDIDDKDKNAIRDGLHFSNDRVSENSYIGGMIKLQEIAVKAMSPGINDPGTAIDSIHKITKLLAERLRISDYQVLKFDDGAKVIITEVPLYELIEKVITPIRIYSQKDPLVMKKLKQSLSYLKEKSVTTEQQHKIISDEIKNIDLDTFREIKNTNDQNIVFQ